MSIIPKLSLVAARRGTQQPYDLIPAVGFCNDFFGSISYFDNISEHFASEFFFASVGLN